MSPLRPFDPYLDIELRIVDWASAIPDIRAIVVYGSRASLNNSYDEFSDLDLILFTSDPSK